MTEEFNLSDWLQRCEIIPGLFIRKDKVKIFIKKLMIFGCRICGKAILKKIRYSKHINFCAKCREDMRKGLIGKIEESLNKKIDKLAGDKLK